MQTNAMIHFPLTNARVHEVCGGASCGFASICVVQTCGQVLWIREAWKPESINPVGAVPYFDPARLLLAQVSSQIEGLAVAEEALRDGVLPLVIIELSQPIDLTAGRRLQLAARAGKTTGLCIIPEGMGSNAAETRWRCRAVFDPAGPDSTLMHWGLIKNKLGTLSDWYVRWNPTKTDTADRLASDRVLRLRPVAGPFALTLKEQNAERIYCLNTEAEQASLHRGMPFSDARAFCPELLSAEADLHADQGMLLILPQCGVPEQRYINNRFEQWRTHIVSLHKGLPKKAAAKQLGLGCVGFDNLVKDGVLRPIKSRIFAKPRFDPVTLAALMAPIERHLRPNGEKSSANVTSISKACFATSCATSTVINLLINGHLKSAISSEQNQGFAGILIDPVELKSKLASFSKTGLSIEGLRDTLGLQYRQVKHLIARGLLPAFTDRKTCSSRRAMLVDPSDLTSFLCEYQTIRTAASRLGISENVLRIRVSSGSIVRAPEGGGMLIYRTAKILTI